jgi:hypothetical protein
MRRSLTVAFLAFAGLCALAAPPAASQTAEAGRIETDLRLERKLLSLDLVAYKEVRARELGARQRLDEVQQRLDQSLAADALSLGSLETLYDQVTAAREAARTAAARVDRQIERVEERMRRIAFLESEARPGRENRSPIAGRWRLSILPQGVGGVMDLRVNGTIVTGTYQLASGSAGTFRGTYAGGVLQLERIDSRNGFDSSFTGRLDPASGALRGTWQAHELASGQPAAGDWSAVRIEAGGGQP